MSSVKFGGTPVELSGEVPGVGQQAPEFTFVKDDLSDANLTDYDGKAKVLVVIPSIMTGVCQKEARHFNEKISAMDGAVGILISKDLPFAFKNFCEAEGLEDIISASDFRYNDFGSQYNVELTDSAFKGLFARVVLVLDKNNKIVHKEEVEEIGHEPDYEAALSALQKAL